MVTDGSLHTGLVGGIRSNRIERSAWRFPCQGGRLRLSLLTGQMNLAVFVKVGFVEIAMVVEVHGVLDEDSMPVSSVDR